MRYIEPPTSRKPKGQPPIKPRKRKEDFWIKLILALGTALVIYLVSQYIR